MGVVTCVGILGEDLSMYRGLLACCIAPIFVALLAASALAASGGPDSFGYRYIDSQESGGPSYNFRSTSNQLGCSGSDDCSDPVSLPFTFSFYGTNYTTINVNSNGNATFGSGFTTWNNTELSGVSQPGLHPWWDDWNPSCQSDSIIKTGTAGSSPNQIFVITWESMRQYQNCSSDPVTFQVQLFEGSNDVQFHYQDATASGVSDWNTGETVSNGGAGTIGISPGSSSDLQFSFNSQSIAASRAIRFYSNESPTAVAAGPFSGSEGSAVTLSDGGSSDSDGSIVSYDWDCTDDGTYDGSGASYSGCVYPNEGSYTARLRVTDDDGSQHSATAVVSIANLAPVVTDLSGDGNGVEGSALVWTATATDPGPADVLSYSWDFGDGTNVSSGTSPSSSHSYLDEGSYTVTVTVTDDASPGLSDSDSIVVTVTNAPPSGLVITAPSGDEGELLTMSALAGDPGSTDSLSYSWDFGDGSPLVTGASVTHTYINDGQYIVTVTCSDGDGGSVVGTTATLIANLNPAISSLTGDSSGVEGTAMSWSALASDPGLSDTLTYTWDFGDLSPTVSGASPSATHTYVDEGSYVVTLTVSDDASPAGSTSSTLSLVVDNVAPSSLVVSAPSGTEGELLAMSAQAQDPGADTLIFTWDFGDGSATVQGALVSHSYDDEGSYTVTVVVSDGDGGSETGTAAVVITNVAPSISALSGDLTGDEGASLSWLVVASDPGFVDVLVYSWDFGDGSAPASGASATHTFADDGSYTVSVTVDDQDGGVVTDSVVVVVDNVAPELTSTPPAYGAQDVVYSYQPTVVDPGNEVFTWSLAASAPASMTIDANTGLITWTPDYTDSLAGSAAVTLMVDDGDGATDAQSWTIQIGYSDGDGDGMADSWETDNGLDPSDPSDASGDADGDGVSNLDEFTAGTDPDSFDGPEAPELESPIGDEETDSSVPFLVLNNAFDPQGDALVYDFEVYEDAAMAVLLAGASDQQEDPSGQSHWKVDVPLAENSTVYWRARASDGLAEGPFSVLESFFVNELNEEPSAPVAQAPVDDGVLAASAPLLEWSPATDPDGDVLSYEVEVRTEDGSLVAYAEAVAEGCDSTCSWSIDVALNEDQSYAWSVSATDEHGLSGLWSEPERFRFSDTDEAPVGIVFLDPLDGSELDELAPLLVASEGHDPEGRELSYQFVLDVVESFDSEASIEAELAETGSGEVVWSLADDGIALSEDTQYFARVRGVDPAGLGSPWDVISFFVSGTNSPPSIPELLAPLADASPVPLPLLVLANVVDPEDDTVFYDFLVATDESLSEVVAEHSGVLEGVGAEAGSGADRVVGRGATSRRAVLVGPWRWMSMEPPQSGLRPGP